MPLGVLHGEFRLTGEPQLKFAQSGVAICNVRLASGSRKKNGDEWVDDKSLFIDATAFKKQAENMAETLAKGDLVVVIGKIQTEEWEKEGEKHSKIALVIDSIGPSLAWKTATLHETERTSGSSQPSQASTTSETPAQSDDPPF